MNIEYRSRTIAVGSRCFVRTSLILMCSICFFSPTLIAQSFGLQLIPTDKDTTFLNKQVTYQRIHTTDFSVKTELKAALEELRKKSFYGASMDSLMVRDSVYVAYIFIGNAFKWTKLENGNVEKSILEAVNFRENTFKNKLLDIQKIEQLQQRILAYCENNGYPFARVFLENIQLDSNTISAQLFLEKKQLITFEEISIEGNATISKAYLENYLGIKAGNPYDESLLRQVAARVRAVPFLKEKRGLAVIFKGNTAEVTLFLEKNNASRFDLIVGFLPANQFTGRPLITGSFQGMLQNPFGTGKVIGVDWQRLKAQTSRLQMNFSYPYILDLPFGFDGKMDIYRRDSTLQDTKFDLGMQYLFQGNNYVKIFWKSTANNTLSVNENQIITSRQLPAALDLQNTQLGMEYFFQKLNNRINPVRGYSVRLQGGAGIKQIRQNSLITSLVDKEAPAFDFSTLYDSLQLRTFQMGSEASLAYFQPIGKRATIKIGVEAALLYSPDSLYQNEVYRIGGNRLLRGFDEESVLASFYSVATIEPRLLLNETSYLFAFLDVAYLQNRTIGTAEEDVPVGFGLGLSLNTPAGIVRVSYALGRQLNNPFDFRAAKIHFGYVNYF